MDGIVHSVVGVMPEGFGFPGQTDVWIPRYRTMALSLGEDDQYELRGLLREGMTGRLREGATFSQAQAEADALFARLKEMGGNPGDGVQLRTLRELLTRDYWSALVALLAGSAPERGDWACRSRHWSTGCSRGHEIHFQLALRDSAT